MSPAVCTTGAVLEDAGDPRRSRVRRRPVDRPGPSVGVRRCGPRSPSGPPRLRRVRRARRQDVFAAERVGPDGDVVATDVSPRAGALERGRRQAARVRAVAARARRCSAGRRRLVRPGARRRPLLGHRLRAPSARSCCGASAQGASSAGSPALQVAIAVAGRRCSSRPGGRLVYSVCTFPRAETDAACDAILRRRPDLSRATVRARTATGRAPGCGRIVTAPTGCSWRRSKELLASSAR